ncbi:cupin domain-containing protein [Intestinibacter bartlettii]|uniref:Cupin domain-containing protein n=1 Tax=Intestinibacter bartlettii TaxID=261299 RepID=A0ABS6DZ25_9FIRM|nr:cupin domain-containing protein [Intestinibacter bartlettii]MBU5336648.1 cupin domain-containing protein [Intestinibacter bartlettii]MDO5010080.1 cupin domain-containing protein [Intestinibacter bartlettii]
MIKRKNELTRVVGPIEGGKGEIDRELLIEGEELQNKAKVFAKLTVPVGASVGLHEHTEDYEVYYILSGKGKVLDGDEIVEVNSGDVVYAINTKHYIENIGDEDLVFLAVIINL